MTAAPAQLSVASITQEELDRAKSERVFRPPHRHERTKAEGAESATAWSLEKERRRKLREAEVYGPGSWRISFANPDNKIEADVVTVEAITKAEAVALAVAARKKAKLTSTVLGVGPAR